MNFLEAVQAMKDGEIVECTNSSKSDQLYSNHSGIILRNHGFSHEEQSEIHIDDILSGDWIVVE